MHQPGPENLITDVPGILVGNAEDRDARTGVTVLLGDRRLVAAADVRGGAPGTRDISLLDPDCMIEDIHAICLSGGSVFGLEAAAGVTMRLAARGIGFTFRDQPHVCPIVPSAILFDLANGGNKAWGDTPPYRALGIAAHDAAARRFALGKAGAGLGCTAGNEQGGLGSASLRVGDFIVGALVAVNSVGAVRDPRTGALWAAPYAIGDEMGQAGAIRSPGPLSLTHGTKLEAAPGSNTTLAIVACDAPLDKAQCRRIAIMATDGMARALRPVHHPFDGDTVFAVATGEGSQPTVSAHTLGILGTAAADVLTRAIGRAIHCATPPP